MQVLGGLIKQPSLLSETNKYQLDNKDFPERFHTIIFAAINNLYQNGTSQIDEIEVDGFLSQYDVQYEIFNQNKGVEYLQNIQELFKEGNFDYYYGRLKKFTLLREMDGVGFDISEIYDTTIMNPREQEKLLVKFDKMTIADILRVYESKMIEIQDRFEADSDARSAHAGEGIHELLERIEDSPEIGLPLNGDLLTSVFRGARKTAYLLRSSITGGGKSRLALSNALILSALGWYDSEKGEWVKNEFAKSCVFITTEMLVVELQTPAIAFIADVEEHKILRGQTTAEEKERIHHAANILEKSNLYIEELPNFNLQDISRTIEKNIIQYDIEYVYFDYIHSSIDIFSEISQQSGIRLREDQILLLMSNNLKALANKFNVHLMSATQLNGAWKEAWQKGDIIDDNLLAGSKAIAQKVDGGMIVLPISQKEKKEIQEILSQGFYPEPTHVTHIYKNRGNPHDSIKIFSKINMGTIRTQDLFCTNQDNEIIDVEVLKIHAKESCEMSLDDTSE